MAPKIADRHTDKNGNAEFGSGRFRGSLGSDKLLWEYSNTSQNAVSITIPDIFYSPPNYSKLYFYWGYTGFDSKGTYYIQYPVADVDCIIHGRGSAAGYNHNLTGWKFNISENYDVTITEVGGYSLQISRKKITQFH